MYSANQIIINNNDEKTTSAIVLYPSGNHQNGWIFMSINNGRILCRHQWKKLPIRQKIIDKVDAIGTRDNQTLMPSNFKYRLVQNIRLSDDDDSHSDREESNINESEDESVKSLTEFYGILADDINEIVNNEVHVINDEDNSSQVTELVEGDDEASLHPNGGEEIMPDQITSGNDGDVTQGHENKNNSQVAEAPTDTINESDSEHIVEDNNNNYTGEVVDMLKKCWKRNCQTMNQSHMGTT